MKWVGPWTHDEQLAFIAGYMGEAMQRTWDTNVARAYGHGKIAHFYSRVPRYALCYWRDSAVKPYDASPKVS